ncbi:MAG: tetratricopeptide repeat protein [Cytophagaceae bacterium]|nr:tetratricopeptide repeat protein [Cytophagaceae bacterium]MDW8455516.1 tetratricopeptide repeat protein [Cytophagaceae bacterium]
MAKNKENKTQELEETKQEHSVPSESRIKLDADYFILLYQRYRNVILIVMSVIAVGILAIAGYKYMRDASNQEAQSEMFMPVYFWEQDSLDRVLKGGKGSRAMPEIAEEYSNTKAGKLAYFYTGVAYLKKGKYQEAIDNLENFNTSDKLLQARSYSLIGDAYMELKDIENAIKYYEKATRHYPNEYFTPRYFMKLGLAYELNKDLESALKAYATVADKYPNCSEATDAKKNKAKVEGLLNQQ